MPEVGAWREETLIGHLNSKVWKYDGIKHGGYYTRDEVKEIVEYAKLRHIEVVPEIDVPSHCQALLASYPELATMKKRKNVMRRWGASGDVLKPTPQAMKILKDILDEVCTLFPYDFIHMGGDQVPSKYWAMSDEVKSYMKSIGIENEKQLLNHFFVEVSDFLSKRGKRIIGWQEMFAHGDVKGAVVMNWKDTNTAYQMAQRDYEVISTPYFSTFLDYIQSYGKEPVGMNQLCSTIEIFYTFEPCPSHWPSELKSRIIGSQGQFGQNT